MNIVFLKSATRDVKKIRDAKAKSKIREAVLLLQDSKSINKLSAVKKLAGHPEAFRMSVGRFRLGFYLRKDTIFLARVLKRNDIYKVIP